MIEVFPMQSYIAEKSRTKYGFKRYLSAYTASEKLTMRQHCLTFLPCLTENLLT